MQYLEEGYTSSEAKKLAKAEVEDMIDSDTEFINEIIKQEYDDD